MADEPTYAESLYSELELGWAPLHAWRTAGFKFIKAPQPELYDLEKDASETTNRAGGGTGARRDLDRQARSGAAPSDALAPRRQRSIPRPRSGCARSATRAAAAPSRRAGAALRDPKDGVRLLPRLNRGMSAARTEPELAIRELTAVLKEDPGLFMARRTRAVAYAAAGRHDLAIADLRVLDKEGQLTPEDAVVLGDNLRSAGRLEEASLILERAAAREPDVSAAADLPRRGPHPGTQIR